ncbi:MAG: c-type cytochrome [bacterium]|nr:c-type cytochrome [bacterium]
MEPIVPLPRRVELDERKVALGEELFGDVRLSGDGTVSCATCHIVDDNGAGSTPRSVGTRGSVGERNAPTVFNSGFNFRQFWDGRARSLEEQVDGPLLDPKEMDGSWDAVLRTLGGDAAYSAAFEDLYGGVTREAVRDAIATFERSLITPDAPFDLFLRGDEDAIAPTARRGYQLFKDLGCVACHQGLNVGGNMFQKVGVARVEEQAVERGSFDLGRYEVTGKERDKRVFKVPGLRNVARTAPYFHDGSVATLPEAVRIMGLSQLGRELEVEEVEFVVAFLESLTGERLR